MILHENPQLNSLEIVVTNQPKLSFKELFNMLDRNYLLTKLALSYVYWIPRQLKYDKDIELVVSAVPNLIELNIPNYEFSTEYAVNLLKRFRPLQLFCFAYSNEFRQCDFIDELNKNGFQTKSLVLNSESCKIELIR